MRGFVDKDSEADFTPGSGAYPQVSVDDAVGDYAATSDNFHMTEPVPISAVMPDVLAHIEAHSPRPSEAP